ncbi:hypothetical protein GWK47_051652 [Chionoecetes opilio]|uniref:Uncharacterized protein n=1 Tax=Chionoecetes opilio TaxID=41210 RepID=A0A8J4Y0Q3_CHIOP|nr:hypothetical protein GWK47_051652 [Chionoecetes opilio]
MVSADWCGRGSIAAMAVFGAPWLRAWEGYPPPAVVAPGCRGAVAVLPPPGSVDPAVLRGAKGFPPWECCPRLLGLFSVSAMAGCRPAPLASAEIGLDVAAGEDSSTITTGNMAQSDCFDTDVGVLPKPQYQPQPPTT